MDWNGLNIVISRWELGAGKKGSSAGPDALVEELQKHLSFPSDPQQVDHHNSNTTVGEFAYLKNGQALLEHQKNLADQIENVQKKSPYTLLLSGDHSNAIGGISGFCRNKSPKNVGIVWIDAHLDLHSPYTTPSGNIHGMSLNCIIESDNIENQKNELDEASIQIWEDLKRLKKTSPIAPENIVFIGIRSFEKEELELINKLGIKVIYAQQIQQNGISWVIEEVKQHLHNQCNEWYVSFDVDSLDPAISVGTGTPEPGGLEKAQALTLLEYFWKNPFTKMLEITEINPALDQEKPMAKEISDLLRSIIN